MSGRKHRFTLSERYGVWRASEGVCCWCEEPLDFRHATVDHIVPESLGDDATALRAVLADYGLPHDFDLNDFPNWVPSCQPCNGKKAAAIYARSPVMIGVLHRAGKRADVARRAAAEAERPLEPARAVARLDAWLAAEVLTVSDLADAAERRGGLPAGLNIVGGTLVGSGRADSDATGGRPDDPFSVEIEAYRKLSDRGLYAETLAGLEDLQARCGARPDAVRSRFRIANNLGVCLMGLGRLAEARLAFMSAINVDDRDDLPHVNLAAVCFIEGDFVRALEVLRRPIRDEDMRGKACALRIGALYRLGRRTEVDDLVEAERWAEHDPHVQLAVARMLYAAGEVAELGDRIEVALAHPSTAMEANVFAAMVALNLGDVDDQRFVRVNPDTSDTQLALALQHFRCALELCPQHLRDGRAELHGNCGMVLVLLGEVDQAKEEFARARSAWSRPNLTVVVNHAALLMQEGEFTHAAGVIRDSGLAGGHPRVRLQLGAALLGAEAFADVVDLFGATWTTLDTEEEQVRAAAMVLAASRRLELGELAQGVCARLSEHTASWSAWFHLGRHYAEIGALDKARHAFEMALDLSGPDDSAEVREELACRQAAWRDHAGCITTLEPLPPESLGDAAAQALIVSLYNTGGYARARVIADAFLGRERVPRRIVEVAVAIASLAGDLPRAIKLQERLRSEHPARLKDVNCLATLLLRSGERERAASVLAIEVEAMPGAEDAHELMVFAHLLSAVGDKRALDFGYRSWERAGDQPQVQLGFVGLVLRREREGRAGLDREVAEPGATLELSSPNKSVPRKVSLLRPGDMVPDAASWVHAAEPLAARLLGKRVGDVVAGPSSPLGSTTYRVERVYSNYIRAFQETISGYNERFPEADGLWKFEVPNDDPTEITRVLLAMQSDSGRIRQLVNLHTDGKFPMAALAGTLHRSLPVIWSALANDEKARIRFSDGAGGESEVSDGMVERSDVPVYLDYTALMTLVLLGNDLRAKLGGIVGPMRVMQSLLDELREGVVRAAPLGSGKGMNVSIADDGRLRISDIGDERGFLERVESVARELGVAATAYAGLEEAAESRNPAVEALGRPTADLIAEARSTGGRILCDDAALAAMARAEHGIAVASVQGLAQAAHRKGSLSLADYADLVERLTLARYSFVSVNADLVKAVLQRHHWIPTGEVESVFGCLSGPGCTAESAAVVASHVLKAIALEPAAALRRTSLVDMLLARVTDGHDARRVIALISGLLQKQLRLAPIHHHDLQESLRLWLLARAQ